MEIINCIKEEFPQPTYDHNFISDLMRGFKGKIKPQGDLIDNLELFNYIYESFEAIEHPNMVNTVSIEEALRSI